MVIGQYFDLREILLQKDEEIISRRIINYGVDSWYATDYTENSQPITLGSKLIAESCLLPGHITLFKQIETQEQKCHTIDTQRNKCMG